MSGFLRIVLSRWVTTIVGAVLCGAMIWFYGPLLPFLRGALPLGVALVVLTCVTIAANLAIDHVRRRADQALAGGVTKAAGPDAATAEANTRVAEQRDKLVRAMALLRKARGTRGYLYEQPWYVIIGPPGSGKTTTLENSGLKFPLAADLGQAKLSGVGGTRLCDWWFADEATLIDTAGRYTTQDSDAAADRTEWLAFLDLLKRTRPRQPLNGIIVAIAMNEIVGASPALRLAHARAVRSRIKEINKHLHARIPVYAMFTKADLILGFTEFFDDLGREQRAQVWGTTFPLETADTGSVDRFADEFRTLVASLSARVLDRLQAERSLERRALIAAFPTQVASMEAPLSEFLQEAFAGTRLDPAPALRGVYLVSATQEGNPIDRLAGTLARSFGLDQRQVESLRPQQGGSYFIDRLVKQVIFGEAMLGLRNPSARRRRMALRIGAWGLSAAVAFGGVLALWLASGRSAAQVAVFDTQLSDYTKAVGAARLDPVPLGGADLLSVKPLLDKARALPFGAVAGGAHGGPIMLSQAEKLGEAAHVAYRRALEHILLPRLVSLLEARMAEYGTDIDKLYPATRVYMMLTDTRHLDPGSVHAWMDEDWSQHLHYQGPTLGKDRIVLLQHLDALMSEPWTETVAANPQLLSQSRLALGGITLQARIYDVLRSLTAAQQLPPWVPADAIGPLADRLFVRRSGRPLSDPIPGLYTVEGFQTVIWLNLRKATEQVVRQDGWVLGGRTQFDMDDVAAVKRNDAAVIDLYARDYAAHWDKMLADLNIVPPANDAAPQTFKILASPQSPIRTFLAAVVEQLVLTEPGSPPPAGATAPRPAAGAVPPAVPGSAWFDGHYRALRDFVGPGPRAQLDNVLGLLDQLQQQIAAQVAANQSGTALPVPPGGDAAAAVDKAADDWAPEPVRGWLRTLAGRGGAVRSDAERRQAALAFASGSGGSGGGGGTPQTLCQQVTGRYPFRAGVRDDVSLPDFSDLFAPNGRLDAFFTQYIRPYVDTTQKPWRVHDVAGVQAPVTPDSVAQFQRAADIRDTFFAGSAMPRIQFALRPLSLDAGARQVTLDFGGVAQTYTQGGPSHALPFDWPGATRMTDVQVVFDPPSDGGARLQQTGPWALFRLFAQGRLQRVAGSEKFNLTFSEGERQASFELTAATLHNPFAGDLFAGFRCPAMRP